MDRHFDHELAELKQKLLTMASHAEKSVSDAVNALVNRDLDLALAVNANDEVLDRFELDVDEMAINLLAKAPLASELRMVTMAMKLSQNLERVGDEATKIAKRARDLSKEPPLKLNLELAKLSLLVLGLLKSALDSFVQKDSAAARAVIPRDKEINALHKQIQGQIIDHMKLSPDNIQRSLHLLVAVKSLERIGDHATNIAEEVVYLCEAQDIRHADKG
ncbi:MAG: phosphate signaling complex protein PhoU [Verrucomicrobia bacterium]|jgi:phosphate transport system protein|nr:MAG: phosphate signaling complex protein PhoU [Verrucomicrobiota bacterium]